MEGSTNNIIKLAWSDKISFEKIKRIYGLSESEVIKIMRKNLNLKLILVLFLYLLAQQKMFHKQ